MLFDVVKNRAELRRMRANERAEAAAGRTPAEQLERLRDRGHGHCAEARRLSEVVNGKS